MRIHSFIDASLVPDSRAGRRLALAALVSSFGTGMFLTGSAVYFTRVIGLSPAQVGIGLSAAGLAGLLGSVPIGILADRAGPGRVYVALQWVRALGYVGYLLVSAFPGFVAVAALIEVCDAASPAIGQAVVSLAVGDEERVATLAKMRAVRNLGFGLGAAAAVGVLASESRPAFLAMILLNAAAIAGAALLMYRVGIARLRAAAGVTRRFRLAPNTRYLATALLNGVLSVHMTLLFVGLPLWITGHTHVPIALIGVLVVVNTVLAVALQARFAAPAQRLSGAVTCMVRSGFAIAGFSGVAYLMGRVQEVVLAGALALLGVVLLTCGELWQSAGGWAISYELAPEARQSQYLATFQLGTALQVMIAPAAVVGLVFRPWFGWFGLALVTALAGLLVRAVVPAQAPVETPRAVGSTSAGHPGGTRPT
jgi:MFS family permease